MKIIQIIVILSLYGISKMSHAQSFDYQRDWATYFGDEDMDLAGEVVDVEGNIYITGRVLQGSVFNSTSNAHQTIFGGGVADGFLTKINPEGEILWSTFIGGESVDYITGITIDGYNNIYIIGITGSANSIATSNAWQTTLEGSTDVFINKFNEDGTKIWGSYYPSTNSDVESTNDFILVRGYGIVADKQQDGIYFYNRTDNSNLATSGVFQTTIGQASNNVITKFSLDGQRIWATYYGINFSNVYSITLGVDGLYVAGNTNECLPTQPENTYFATTNAHQPEPGSCRNIFVTKISFTGERLWSTYYGNTLPGYIWKKGLLAVGGALYVSGTSTFSANITTTGSYQEESVTSTPFLVKFNTEGTRLWGTYIGLDLDISSSSITHSSLAEDSQGNIYLTGMTFFQENISTVGAYQETKADESDSFIAKFNPDGNLQWGTYYGSNEMEYSSNSIVYNDVFYMFGETSSTTGITTPNSYQPNFIDSGNSTGDIILNMFIVRFEPLLLNVDTFNDTFFEIYPNPSQGSFNVKNRGNNTYTVKIFNVLGQLVLETAKKTNALEKIETPNLNKGLYLIKITTDINTVYTKKLLINN